MNAQASDAGPPYLKGARLGLLTLAISLATFMEVLDMTIVNVSIPAISGTLGVSPSEGTWTISSYTLAAAIMQPLTGWLAKRFGEVRTFVTSGLLFVVFSALCGLAVSMPMLVVGRLLQGLVSGPMVPMAQAILLRNYPPEKRGMAMALWAMVIFIAPICGPVMGGWITDNVSWPWLFFINLPVGVFAVGTSYLLLRRRETEKTHVPVDVMGLIFLVIGVGSLQFMLDNGNEKDWFHSGIIIAAGVAAVIAITLLITWELTEKHPVLDLHLFTHRNFTIGISCICLGFFCFFGAVVIYPLWLQTTVGYTAFWAGLATAPVGLLGLLLMPVVGRNIQRMNLRVFTSLGFIVLATVMFWMSSLNEQAQFSSYVFPRLLQGVGLAFFFLPLQQIMFSDVGPNELAAASGLSNFLRNIAGSVSTAVCVFMWTNRADYHHAVLAESVQRNAAWLDWSSKLGSMGGGPANAVQDQGLSLAYTQMQVMQQAQTLSVNDITHVFGFVLLALVPLVWFARPPFKGQSAGAH
jgi:DHA2 family multidrug resistance protein